MNKFRKILPTLLPKHFKVKPLERYVTLAEPIPVNTGLADARLVGYLEESATELIYDNLSYTFKDYGVIKIDDEYIKYTGNTGSKLTGLTRGWRNSRNEFHYNDIVFEGVLINDIDLNDQEIEIGNIKGEPNRVGGFIINGEYIKYREYKKTHYTHTFFNCIRGSGGTVIREHAAMSKAVESEGSVIEEIQTIRYDSDNFSCILSNDLNAVDTDIYFTDLDSFIEMDGSIKIDDEYIRFENIEYTNGEMTEGYFTSLTQTETRFNKEVTTNIKTLLRGTLGSKPKQHVAGTIINENRLTEFQKSGILGIGSELIKYYDVDSEFFYISRRGVSNTESGEHIIGDSIVEFFFDNDNQTLIELLDVIGEHLDVGIEGAIVEFSKLNDVDETHEDYLRILVKSIGEDIDDYRWLDIKSRLFSKNLTSLYKTKGTLNTLKTWNTLINQPLKSEIDLWTYNYCDFYSLPLLALWCYIDEKTHTPRNYYFPQISKNVYTELLTHYTTVEINGLTADNFKLLIKSWNYINMSDDDKLSDSGFKFDDRLAPCNNTGEVTIRVNNPELDENYDDSVEGDTIHVTDFGGNYYTEYAVPDLIMDYDIDLFKSEDDIMNPTSLLVNSIDKDSTTIIINNLSNTFYNPYDYFKDDIETIKPIHRPLGFIKIEDELISYVNITETSPNTFTLTDCTRGIHGTNNINHNITPFSDTTILQNRTITEIGISGNYRLNLNRDVDDYKFIFNIDTITIECTTPTHDGTYTITNYYKVFDVINNTWNYGIEYSDVAGKGDNTSLTTSNTVITRYISVENSIYNQNKHLLWRLQNEVNGLDKEFVYKLEQSHPDYEYINEYTNLEKSIIFPTPHFEYNVNINPPSNTDFTLIDLLDTLVKKIKEYKPKHTVMHLLYDYDLGEVSLELQALLTQFYLMLSIDVDLIHWSTWQDYITFDGGYVGDGPTESDETEIYTGWRFMEAYGDWNSGDWDINVSLSLITTVVDIDLHLDQTILTVTPEITSVIYKFLDNYNAELINTVAYRCDNGHLVDDTITTDDTTTRWMEVDIKIETD